MDFLEIVESIDTFNNLNIVNKIERPVYVDKRKGNQYELDQFNWTMKCRNYRQNIKKLSKGIKQYEEVESIDKLQELLYKNDLSQSWSRLEKKHKLEKLSEYLSNLDIKREHLKKIKVFTYTKFKKGKFKSSKSVIYDKEEHLIKEIPLVNTYIQSLK